MKHETFIYIIIGSAVVGVAYYLWKQEQVSSTSSSGGILSGAVSSIQNNPAASLAVDSELGLTGLAGWIYGEAQ